MDLRSRFVLFIMVLSLILLICGVAFADEKQNLINEKIFVSYRLNIAKEAIKVLEKRVVEIDALVAYIDKEDKNKIEILKQQEAKKVKAFEDKLKKEEEAKKAKETEKNKAKVQEEFTKSKLDDVIKEIKKEEDKK